MESQNEFHVCAASRERRSGTEFGGGQLASAKTGKMSVLVTTKYLSVISS